MNNTTLYTKHTLRFIRLSLVLTHCGSHNSSIIWLEERTLDTHEEKKLLSRWFDLHHNIYYTTEQMRKKRHLDIHQWNFEKLLTNTHIQTNPWKNELWKQLQLIAFIYHGKPSFHLKDKQNEHTVHIMIHYPHNTTKKSTIFGHNI